MNKVLLIAFGGALGAVLRYALSTLTQNFSNSAFPYGTLLVNLSGALLIGFLWGIFESVPAPSSARIFLLIGILGSYTTFSTFYLDNFHMMRNSEFGFMALNILLSNILGIAFAFLGYYCSRLVVH